MPKNNSIITAVVGSPLTGSVGSPTVDRQVAQFVRPLRVVVEEVRALKEMGKDPISKDEGAVRRLLNALHRVFTVGALGNNYGCFWDFLIAIEEQINKHQETRFDRFAKEVSSAKDKVAGRVRLPSHGPFGPNDSNGADPVNGGGVTPRQSMGGGGRNRSSSGVLRSAATFVDGFPPPTPAQEKALVRSIEHVRSFNILNKLNCLHYWLIAALQQGGVLSAALACAVVPMRDVLQAYLGPDSPFYAKQASLAESPTDGEDGGAATLCYPFLNELRHVFEDLEVHPEMGAIRYNLDITCMQLFQTVTDRAGNLIVGINGADNTEQIEYYVPNALYTTRGGGRGRRRRRNTRAVGVNTEAVVVGNDSLTGRSMVGSPLRGISAAIASSTSNAAPSNDLSSFLPSQQLMSEATAVQAFYGTNPLHNASEGGAKGKKDGVLTFAELCEMQKSLLEEKRELRARDDALADREKEVALREQEVQDANSEIVGVLLKLKDLYFKHVVGLRERQEMGLRISAKDIDRKVPQLLQVLEEGDFDMVADEDELNAAGLARTSQRRFVADSIDSPSNAGGDSVTSRPRASSSMFAPNQSGVGVKPLVIDDPNDAVPLSVVVGIQKFLRLEEPPEKERNQQLKAQNFLCADCGTSFGGEGNNNVLLKTFQKTSEILTMQKPRRCHYCTELLCHNCHSNQTALLPFRVIPKWDFSNKHVCKRCHTFLQQNYSLAHYDLRKIPREVATNQVLQQCALIRKFLMRAAMIISGCTRRSSATFADDLHTHYFQREYFYSMSDLNMIHSTDRRESNPANIVPGVSNVVGAMQWVAGVNVDSLVDKLAAKLQQCKNHIRIDCANCKTRASSTCTICNVPQPVFIVDEDGTQCRKCHTIYHLKCFDAKGCPTCADSAAESASTAVSTAKRR